MQRLRAEEILAGVLVEEQRTRLKEKSWNAL